MVERGHLGPNIHRQLREEGPGQNYKLEISFIFRHFKERLTPRRERNTADQVLRFRIYQTKQGSYMQLDSVPPRTI